MIKWLMRPVTNWLDELAKQAGLVMLDRVIDGLLLVETNAEAKVGMGAYICGAEDCIMMVRALKAEILNG